MATWKKIITAADDSAYKNEKLTLAQLDTGLDGETGYTANAILAVNGAGNAIEWTTPTTGDITGVTVGEGIDGTSLEGPVPDLVLKLSELTTSTSDADGDFFAVVDDAGAQKLLSKAYCSLSGMDNDDNWTDDTAADAAQATANAALPKAGGAMTGAITTNSTFDGVDIATRDGVLSSTTTTANAALPKAGGAMTGAITTNSTFDGVDIATRHGLLSSTTTTANAALPKAGGAMTGAITTNSTFDGVDIATRDGVLSSTTTTANAALPKAGGQITGNITCSGTQTIDGKDVSTLGTAAEGAAAAITLLAALDSNDTTYIGDNGNDTTLHIRGNLTVAGTTTTINTTNLAIADNQVVLNSDETGTPSIDAGMTIERGSSVDSQLFWDESAKQWSMISTGDYYSDSSAETSVTAMIPGLTVGSDAPIRTPSQGCFFYDTDDDALYVCTVNTSVNPV